MNDEWKTPAWDETLVFVSRRLLQECALALDETRGLIQRLESRSDLDARDKRALSWGHEASQHLREVLMNPRVGDPAKIVTREGVRQGQITEVSETTVVAIASMGKSDLYTVSRRNLRWIPGGWEVRMEATNA